PIGAGRYLIEASIILVEEDPGDILYNVTSIEICYNNPGNISANDIIYVAGTYYDGACPIPYTSRVVAQTIFETDYPEEPENPWDDPLFDPDNEVPEVITSSAEPTETTVTLRGILRDDGGIPCKCSFGYYKYQDRRWYTDWVGYFRSGTEFSQEIVGLEPDTTYLYFARADQDEEFYGYYDTGLMGTFTTLPETISPIPDPVLWSTEPNQVDKSSITMTAEIARDMAGPEEYVFDFVASHTGGAGGSDSIWQFEPTYLDVGLNPNHQYGYRVKARDGLGNETVYSSTKYTYSDIESPENVEFGEITTDSIQARSGSSLSGLDRGDSGLKIENIKAGQVSPWQQNNNFWTSEGLLPNTQYGFKIQARNGDGDRTAFSPLKWAYTHAKKPTTTGFSNVTVDSINIHWSTNGNPAYTQYWCQNTVSSKNSGWKTNKQWLNTDLPANTRYSYQIKARNGNGVETEFSDTVQKFSAIENPTDVTFGAITANSIQVRSENTPSGLDRENSGLRFENITAGRMSSWQQDNNNWNSDTLLPNRSYSFRAQARNGDGEQTSHSKIGSAYTHANTPTSATFTGITTSSIEVHWSPNGNPPGTLYTCENTTEGTSSGTTILTSWDNTNLQPNTQYSFQVKAQNATGVSTTFSAATQKYSAVETPAGVVFGQVTTNSIQVKSQNNPSGLNRGDSGLRFENSTEAELSQWQQNNNYWTSTGLSPNSLYVFRSQARNGDGDETPYGSTNQIYTLANPPSSADFSYVTDTTIQVNWGTNDNPYGTLYLCENITTGETSGWINSTNWENVDLIPFTTYSYRVKSRNANHIESDWISIGQQTTGYRSLKIESSQGGQVSSPGEDVFQFTPGTTVDIAASSNPGYHFTHWSGSAVDADRVADPKAAVTTVLVDAHYTLVANFLRTNIYVDFRANGANDGSTWSDAFTSLQDALEIAQAGNKVMVAQGVYTPDMGQNYTPGDYTVSFIIPSGVILKGGYAGLENTNPDTRNIDTYETILSGDLHGDDNIVKEVHDLYSEITRLDNSFHIVTLQDADNSTLLEGFTIKGGNSFDGAGIQLLRSDLAIIECTIEENRAGFVSGDGNSGWGEGAGISCYLSEPIISGCVFSNNWAGDIGGAIYNLRSNPTISNCTFLYNSSGMEGGGIYNEDSDCILVNSIFHGNWSSDGGGIFNIDECDSRITNCMFMGNAGRGSGGAIYDAGTSLEIINCIFSGNLAFNDGGALAITQGAGTITNCTFNYNVADNEDEEGGGEALAVQNSTATLTNCILWDHTRNVQPQIALSGTTERNAELIISHCDLLNRTDGISRTGITSYIWLSGNIDLDPRFQDPEGDDKVAGTIDDDLHIRSGSSCIDSGDNTAVPADVDDLDMDDDIFERIPLDFDGRSRFTDDTNALDTGVADSPAYPLIVDIGAYEH
ncbi:fibronectin type III domain-containing protein, partial [Planctomycetota bacterium]